MLPHEWPMWMWEFRLSNPKRDPTTNPTLFVSQWTRRPWSDHGSLTHFLAPFASDPLLLLVTVLASPRAFPLRHLPSSLRCQSLPPRLPPPQPSQRGRSAFALWGGLWWCRRGSRERRRNGFVAAAVLGGSDASCWICVWMRWRWWWWWSNTSSIGLNWLLLLFFFFFLLVVNVIFFWVLYFCFLFSDFDLIYLISFSFEYDVVEFLYFIKIYEWSLTTKG